MQAVRVITGHDGFVVQDIAAPAPKPGAVLVRMQAAMVASYMAQLPIGNWATPPRPFIPGQCAIGIVEQDAGGLVRGQQVYFDAYTGSRDPADPARDHGFLGCFAVGDGALAALAEWPDGSFAETIRAPVACFTPLPPDLGVAPELLCRLGWLGTALHGLEQGGFRAGMRIAVQGATGIVGAGAVVLALAMGAAEVRIFGRRPAVLAQLSALDPRRIGIGMPRDDAPFDLVLDCAGGQGGAASAALAARLRRFASMVTVGGHQAPLALDAGQLMRNSNAVLGSYWFPRNCLRRLIGMVAADVLDLRLFRAERFGLAQIDQAIEFAGHGAGGLVHTVLVPRP